MRSVTRWRVATVMEGAVKVTSGTANSRWELGLGGGSSLRDWEMVLRDVSCLLFIPRASD